MVGDTTINSRAYVGSFNFRGPDQQKFVGNLSGGERNRVHLAKMIRSAGSFGQLMAKEGEAAQIRMPSGEVRQVQLDCRATVGQLSNIESSSVRLGKAGKSRWKGIRPTVRGLAMNPVDHPHGGGEGKSGQGNPHPVSPWGQKTKGLKTRNNRRTDKFIVSRRKPGVRNTPQ